MGERERRTGAKNIIIVSAERKKRNIEERDRERCHFMSSS
jgi:hypothetical protein